MVNFGGAVRINPCGLCIVCCVVGLLVLFSWSRGPPALSSSSTSSTVSLKQLLAVAIEVAARGGIEVVRIREDPANMGEESKGKTKEGANDPKTNGDMLSHRAMYWGIKKAFPQLNVISEEHDVEDVDLGQVKAPSLKNSEVESRAAGEDTLVPAEEIAVWIDPLDATQEYTENLREYVTTMVCVAVNGHPVLGVIHKPFEKRTAWGWAGPNIVSRTVEEDLKGSAAVEDLTRARIIVSRSHAGDVETTAKGAFGPNITVTPAGGAGYKTWEVIRGQQDAYVHTTLIKKWDICAGNAILAAVEGEMTTLQGKIIDYKGVKGNEKNTGGVLATVHHHAKFVEKLSSLAAKPAIRSR